MRIPILQTTVTNLFLLWQIDVGFYEDLSCVRQHIVKVWDIVDHEEVRTEHGIVMPNCSTTDYTPILASKCN